VRILVTGGAGFIGSNYVKHIMNKPKNDDLQVLVIDKLTYAGTLDNLSEVIDKPNLEFIQGDICDSNLIEKLISNCDRVINFAAESHVDRSIVSAEEFVRTNVLGTQVILEAIRENPSIKFIQVSTDEVYGSIESGSWDESFPLKPNSPYAASKASADLITLAYQKTYSLDLMISRCCNNYGPNQFPEKIIPLFITNLIQGKKIPVYGDGLNVREWIHVDDHCRGLELIFEKGRAGEVYNLGSSYEISNLELTKKLITYFGLGQNMIEYVNDRLAHDKRYSLNYEKAKRILGFDAELDFDEELGTTIEWYKKNYDWIDDRLSK
jgi:dTDP-glucose 4,6-dehydratase